MKSFMQDILPDAERASSTRKSLRQCSSTRKQSSRKTENPPVAKSSPMTKSVSGLAQLFTDETIRDAFEELRERREDTDITENEVDDVDDAEVMDSGEYSDRIDVDEEMDYEAEGNANSGDENEVDSITSSYGTIRDDSSHFTEEEDFQTTDDGEDDSITRNSIREDNHDSEMEYDADRSGTSDGSMAQDDSPLFATFSRSEYDDEHAIEDDDPGSGVDGDYGGYGDEGSINMASIDEEEIQIEPEEHGEFRRYAAIDGPGIHESAFEHFRTRVASGILLKEFLRDKTLRDVDGSCAVSEDSEDSEDEDEVDDDYDDAEPPLDGMDIRLRRTLRSAIDSFEELLPDDEDCLLVQKERKIGIESGSFPRPTFPGLRRREAKEVERVAAESNLIGYDSRAGTKRILNSTLVARPEDLLEAGNAAREYWRPRIEQWKDMIETQPTTPKKRPSPLAASTSRRQKGKRKKKSKGSVIYIPRTSPVAKRFATEGLRRKSQEFEIYEDSPSPLKGAEIFDLDAFDDFVEEARSRLRMSICISSSREERDEFKLYEALAVQLVKFLKVKKMEGGEGKVFDAGVLYGLLKDLLKKVEGDDEFVRLNFFNPLVRGIDSGVMLDGEGDVKLVFSGAREDGV